jgi:hypothetical protein
VTKAHTGGEWSVPHFADPSISCNCQYVLGGDYMGAIATVHHKKCEPNNDDPPMAEAIANAYLIASAPDLLAACRKASEWIDAGMPAETRNIHADLDAAIAKATNEPAPHGR